ncbi:MAG: hypothetical protein WCG52_11230 [bacterium]
MKNNCEKYRKPFELCVDALLIAAEKPDPIWPGGMDYKKLNIIIFCIAGPIVFAGSVGLNIVLAVKLARLVR